MIAPVRSSISPKYARARSRPVQNAYPTAHAITTTVSPASQSEKP